MNKKGFLLFILFLFSVTVAYAEYSEDVYSGVLRSGDNFTLDGHRFQIDINYNLNKISVEAEGLGGIVVSNDSCSDVGNYSICLNNIEFGYYNTTTHLDYYKATIDIHEYLALISATKEISKTSLLIGETSRVIVTILNSGSVTANNLVYDDSFANFSLSDVTGCSYNSNRIRWEGSLQSDKSITCSYTITATQATTLQSYGTITYYNGKDSKSLQTPAAVITVSDYPLAIVKNISKNNINLNENATINITLINSHVSYPMDVNKFTIDVPFGLKILGKSTELKLLNNKYTWTGTLQPEESVTFFLILQGELQDTYLLEQNSDYRINNFEYQQESQTPLNVTITQPKIIFQKKDIMYSGEDVHIKVYITNSGSDYIFKELQVDFSTNLPGIQGLKKIFSELKKDSYETIFETDFSAPQVRNETSFYLKIKANYESIYNQYLQLENESSIRILPASAKVVNMTVNNSGEITKKTENVTSATETLNQSTHESKNDTSLLLATEEDIKEKIQLSKNSIISASFIVLDILTAGLIVFALFKLK